MNFRDAVPWLLTLVGGLGVSIAFLIALFFTFTIALTLVKLSYGRRKTLVVRSLDELVPAAPAWPRPQPPSGPPEETTPR